MSQPLPQSWLQSADVLSADLVEGGELLVRFDDDIECVLDLSEAVKQEPGAALADPAFLELVSIDAERRKLVWPNGFEIDTDFLHGAAVVQQRQQALGPQHPETVAARFRLACLYLAAGDEESARAAGEGLDESPEILIELAERFATDAEREFGPDDPRVKSFREGLADVSRTLQNDSQ